MTIAAGFVASDGVLLCADTLYEDGFTKEYRDKIFSWSGGGAVACFALAGSASISRMLIDDCRDRLTASTVKRHTIASVVEIIRPIIKETHEQYVDTRPPEHRDLARFSLLIAIATGDEKAKLFATSDTALEAIDRFECIGNGRQLGRFIIDPSYDCSMTMNEAAVLGLHALVAAKERTSGVGGSSQFVAIREGSISPIEKYELEQAESRIIEYRQKVSGLLMAVGDMALNDKGFHTSLEAFVEDVLRIRANWRGQMVSWTQLAMSITYITGYAPTVVVRPTEAQADPPETKGDS